MSSAGTAYVDVEARTDTVGDAIESALASVDGTVEIVADVSGAEAAIEAVSNEQLSLFVDADVSTVESEIESLEATPVELPVDADTVPAQEEIDSLDGGEPVVKKVEADTEEAKKSIDDLSGSIGALGNVAGVGGAGGALAGLTDEIGSLAGASAGVAAGLGVAVGAFAVAIDAAGEAQAVVAQTDSILSSLGDSAVVTGEHIGELSAKVMEYSGFSDEAVRAGANTLLMFDQIQSAEVFDRAIESAADLAVKMGTDVPSAARMLAVSLSDPEGGMGRLKRQVGDLTDAQKEQIASFMAVGDVASAQGVILDALDGSIGNLAEDYGETMKGGMDRAKEAMGELAESAGSSLLPIMEALSESVVDQTGRLQSWDDALGGALLSGPIQAIAGIGDGIRGVGTLIGELPPPLRDTATAAEEAAASIDELSAEIDAYLSGLYDVPQAQRDAQQAIADLTTTMADADSTWYDIAAAQEEVVTTTAQTIDAMNQQGASQSELDTAVYLSIAALASERDAGRITQQQFNTLSTEIRNVPHKASTEVTAPGLMGVYHQTQDYRAELNRVDATNPTSNVYAHGLASSLNDAIRYSAQLSNLDGRVVDSWVNIHTTGSAKISARGGPLGAGEMSLVGEEGPELFVPNTGGNILPAENTARLMMGLDRKGDGSGTSIVVNVNGTATLADGQAVVDALRRWQQRNGPVPVKVNG